MSLLKKIFEKVDDSSSVEEKCNHEFIENLRFYKVEKFGYSPCVYSIDAYIRKRCDKCNQIKTENVFNEIFNGDANKNVITAGLKNKGFISEEEKELGRMKKAIDVLPDKPGEA